jgi:TnpA family transposase
LKQHWELDELIENWTLLPQELSWLSNKSGVNLLTTALLLKWFQYETKFPNSTREIPNSVIDYLARQLKVSAELISDYNWQGRSYKRHCAEVRQFLGISKATVKDAQELISWLIENVLDKEVDLEHLKEIANQRFWSLKIQPPPPNRVERLVRSALRTYETKFFQQTLDKLSPQCRTQINALLITSEAEATDNTKEKTTFKASKFHFLNSEPVNLLKLKSELSKRWSMTSLLDILKEADLRIGFTDNFKSLATREVLDRKTIQQRLLLCLYGLGTNTGLLRISNGTPNVHHHDLRYIKRRFVHKEALRQAITQVANAIFQIRLPQIWGEGTTTCASDSKKFGAWDQNLMTEWHVRYGGRGVMIYWHVEKNSTCIYSQLKTCSSSEVAAMIEGVLRHDTEMTVKKNFVDSHGQSEVAFAFCHLLGFQLMPRLKAIKRQKLYRPEAGNSDVYSNLQPILSRTINWDLIRQQYDQIIKYTTALRLGTAEPEAILRRFTRANVQHPTYQALGELGKVFKTIFLCQYLHSEEVRREIHEGLNVVENWNSANSFIFYGRSSEFSSNQRSRAGFIHAFSSSAASLFSLCQYSDVAIGSF